MDKQLIKKVYDIVKPIPKDKWTTKQYEDKETGACCFLGHVNKAHSGKSCDSSVESDLVDEVDEFLLKAHGINRIMFSPAAVNDGDDVNGYTEDHPKDRVIHLLEDMLAFEEQTVANEESPEKLPEVEPS